MTLKIDWKLLVCHKIKKMTKSTTALKFINPGDEIVNQTRDETARPNINQKQPVSVEQIKSQEVLCILTYLLVLRNIENY